jgi:hypothetical protein
MQLMVEVSRRSTGHVSLRALLEDACLQAKYCLDAPSEVQDGMQWYEDEDFADCCGPVPRMVELRAHGIGSKA